MNGNDKNKKFSTNYKDYKYVYTGYDDFIKKHHIEVTDGTLYNYIKEE